MSHFVSSEIPHDPINQASDQAVPGRPWSTPPSLRASLANSSGNSSLPSHPIYDLARPGYALYGWQSHPERP